MSKKVLVTLDLNASEQAQFTSIQDTKVTFKLQKNVTVEDVKDKDIIVGNINPNLIKDAQNLEFLQLNSAGYDNYVALLKKDTKLCTCVGAFSPAVGEHILAMTFDLIRHFHLYRDKQNQKDWSDCGKIISVEGSTIAVLGLGDIGRSYARKVKALGAKCVIGVRRNVKDKPDYVDEIYSLNEVDKAVKNADIVVNVLPSSKETVGLFNQKFFNFMKVGAYFINVGRGDAVDQDALLEAIKTNRLQGAALDVTTPEPLPKDSPIWSESRILLTPHVAGWFFLDETKKRIVNIASANVKAYIEGGALKNLVEH